ncbi:OmpA family protein [Acidimangrovimonas pyrenivorans]|uniref:OmpA family protein n=1 Tax=Acidimangrovimonas pyrenivorans TaxID=2030798 RepID=A0ABV7AIS0_9RHOB
MYSKIIRAGMGGAAAAMLAMTISAGAAAAGGTPGTATGSVPKGTVSQAAKPETRTGEIYQPTIWIDPDGCEHWAMDDGAEGYMDIRLDRDGKPICHRGKTCAVMNSDQLFATDKASISAEGKRKLRYFFTHAGAFSYAINGHTDSRASDAYNMDLSKRRAESVAKVARSVGARVASVRWYGERMPIASNKTAAGMRLNRRVEIECIR